MKRITPKRVVLFIGVMSALAFLVYLPRLMREHRQKQAAVQHRRLAQTQAVARKAIENAAAQSAAYRAKYVNRGSFTRRPNLKSVAIAAGFENGKPDRPIADALARRLGNENLVLYTSFFKPSFYTDGLFSNLFAGSTESIDKLVLTNNLDALLLAREHVQYATNGPDPNNVITANARLEVAFLPFGVMRMEQSWTFRANGAGFNSQQAKANAEERLLKQIAGATNLTLLALPPENQEIY